MQSKSLYEMPRPPDGVAPISRSCSAAPGFLIALNDTHLTHPLYNHFLIILAFGKAFVAREISDGRPPGCEYFVHAMATLPDLHVYDAEPLEAIHSDASRGS